MSARILVVDDSLTVRMHLKEAFDAAGFETVLCSTASAARTAAASDHFALAILDVRLPDGDGVELLAELRKGALSDVPTMLLSTEAEVRDRIRGLSTGADEYIGKPYDVAYLIARAKEIVRKNAKTTEAADEATTILVIDDSATYRNELREALASAGYHVVTASTGEDGLRVAADVRPRAVIVDGILPGIDGATVVRRMRLDALLRKTPCLLLTASDDAAAELRAFDSGADAFLRKGDDAEMILARLAALVRTVDAREPDVAASLLGPKKILAVDGSPTYLQALGAELGSEGYDIVLARSGDEAFDLLAVETVDCVLLDADMPGLSGRETCRRLKDSPLTRTVPLVMLSTSVDRGEMLECMNAGADDFVTKSSDFDVLRARVRAQLRRKQFEDENRKIRDELVRKELEAADARSAHALAEARAALLVDLERKNVELVDITRELEAFSYSVSHDLRAPLRAIDGYAHVLVEDHLASLDEDGKRVVGVIMKNTKKMGALIDDLLRFAHMGRQRPELGVVDMTMLANDAKREVLESNRNIDLRIDDLPSARADASLIRQVWLNVLGNAVKYTRSRERAEIEVSAKSENDMLVYIVKDNGVGFDSRYRDKLFGVFQRLHSATEFEGSGVGLALVQRILQRHGGWITAESTLGEGATFSFALPKEIS